VGQLPRGYVSVRTDWSVCCIDEKKTIDVIPLQADFTHQKKVIHIQFLRQASSCWKTIS